MKKGASFQIQWISTAAFLIVGMLLLPIYRFQINPDGIAYLSIARHYGEGRWAEAINNCWSPLLSWLLAPWTLLFDEPLWAFKVINLLAAGACLWVCQNLIRQFKLASGTVLLLVLLLMATLMRWCFSVTTPDMLALLFMLLYSRLIVSGQYLKQPLTLGLIGALAYFAKSYCFFFFTAHLLFQFGFELLKRREKLAYLLKQYALTLSVFLGLASIWMGIASTKYGKFEVSSASAWTHGMVKYANLSCMEGFVPPPNSYASFAWEDPPLVCTYRDWSIFESKENLKLQLSIIKRNSLFLVHVLYKESYFLQIVSYLLMAISLFVERRNGRWYRKSGQEVMNDPLLTFFPIAGIYIFGYLLIFIEPRYIWISYLLNFIGGFIALQRLIGTVKIRTNLILLLITGLCCLGALTSYLARPKEFAPLLSLLSGDKTTYNGYSFYQQAQTMRSAVPENTAMACWGNTDAFDRTQSWNLAYYARLRHFGVLPADSAAAATLIDQYGIGLITISTRQAQEELPAYFEKEWELVNTALGQQRAYRRKPRP